MEGVTGRFLTKTVILLHRNLLFKCVSPPLDGSRAHLCFARLMSKCSSVPARSSDSVGWESKRKTWPWNVAVRGPLINAFMFSETPIWFPFQFLFFWLREPHQLRVQNLCNHLGTVRISEGSRRRNLEALAMETCPGRSQVQRTESPWLSQHLSCPAFA